MVRKTLSGTKYVLLLTVAAVIAASAIWYSYTFVREHTSQLRDSVITILENQLSRNISYSSIDPFFINSITIRDVEIKDDSGKVLAKGEKLTIKFNLLNYLFMNENILKGVSLENGYLNFSQQEDMDFITSLSERIKPEEETPMPRQTKSFYFKGKNLSANFLLDFGAISIDKCTTDILLQNNDLRMSGRMQVSGYDLKNSKMTQFLTSVSFDSNMQKDGSGGLVNLQVDEFKSDFVQLDKKAFLITFDEESFFICNMEDSTPIDYSLTWNRSARSLTAQTMFQDFRPSDIVTFTGNYTKYNDYAKAKGTGNLEITYTPDQNEKALYFGDVDLSLTGTKVPLEPQCHITFSGLDRKIDIKSLTIATYRGNASYSGNLDTETMSAHGTLLLDHVEAADNLVIDTHYDLAMVDSQLSLTSDNLVLNNKDMGTSSLNVNIKEKSADLTLLNLSLKVKETEDKGYSGLINLNRYPMKELEAVFSDDDKLYTGNYLVTADVYCIYDTKDFYITSRNVHIDDVSEPESSLDFAVTSTLDDLKISEIVLKHKGFSGEGYFDLASMRDQHCEFETFWKVHDTEYEFNGFLNKNQNLFIRGLYGFTLSAFFDDNGWPFDMRATDFPLFLMGHKTPADMNISGQMRDGKLSIVTINNMTLSKLAFLKGGSNSINFNGTLIGNTLRLNSWTLSDNYSTVKGTGEASFTDLGNCSGWLRGTGSNLNEEYNAYVLIVDKKISIDASCRNSRVERFTTANMTGILDTSAKITGTFDDPNISASVNVQKGTLMKKPFELFTSLQATKKLSRIYTLTGKVGDATITSSSGSVDWNKREYHLAADLILDNADENIPGSIQLNASGTMQEDGDWIINPATTRNKGTFRLTSTYPVLLGYDRWNFDYDNNGNRFYVDGGPFRHCVEGYYYPDGTLDFNLRNPLFISGKINGKLSGDYVDATLSDIALDMGRVGQLTRYEYFFPLAGLGTGSLRMTGSIRNPDLWGVMKVTDLYFAVLSIPEIIGPTDADLHFQGKDINMLPVLISDKKNRTSVKCSFLLESWTLDYFKVDISSFGDAKRGLRVTDTFCGIDVDGYVLGNLSISGLTDSIMIDGDITVNNCIINLSQNSNYDSFDSSSLTDYIINLNITSGTGVEFFWPTKKVPVLRAFASRGQKVQVQYDSSINQFDIDGTVAFRGGDIFYFSNNFFIRDGLLVLNENQDKFDPLITVNAECRTATRNNQKVKLMFIMDNTPLSHFQPRIEAVPALSQAELYELMGDTIMGGNVSDDERNTMSTLANAGAYGTQLIGILRPFERTVKDFLNVDIIAIRAQLNDKVFNDQRNEEKSSVDMKQVGGNTVFRNIDVFFGKYFGEYFFLDTTIRFSAWDFDTFEYYEYNMPTFYNMYLESEINLEVNTPLFILNLGLYPKLGKMPDFLMDTTIGLSWRFTF